jgi:hypothetical protein
VAQQAAGAAADDNAQAPPAAAGAAAGDNGGEPGDMLTVKRSYMMLLRDSVHALGPAAEELYLELHRDLKKACVFFGDPNIWNHVVRVPYLFSRGVVTA